MLRERKSHLLKDPKILLSICARAGHHVLACKDTVDYNGALAFGMAFDRDGCIGVKKPAQPHNNKTTIY